MLVRVWRHWNSEICCLRAQQFSWALSYLSTCFPSWIECSSEKKVGSVLQCYNYHTTQLFHSSFLRGRTGIPEHTLLILWRTATATATIPTLGQGRELRHGYHGQGLLGKKLLSAFCFFTKNLSLEFLPSDQLCRLFDQLIEFWPRAKIWGEPQTAQAGMKC